VLVVVVRGAAWGALIGFALGGGVGALYLLIGAVYGAPIGAVVGLAVGTPAAILVAAALAWRHRRPTDPARVQVAVQGLLAALVVALVGGALVAGLVAYIRAEPTSGTAFALAAWTGFVVAVAAAATRLLRPAARDLASAWLRSWGWRWVP
jgi:hypothetical protein